MPSNQLEALMTCGCCGGNCVGCCVPVDEGTNAPQNIPYAIVAPSCSELDGFSSVFLPSAPPPSQSLSRCGVCGIYYSQDQTPTIEGRAYMPPAPCSIIPVSSTFGPWTFTLHCEERSTPRAASGLDDCCSRLLLGVTIGDIAGGIDFYIAPSSCSCDGGLSIIFPLDDMIVQTWLDPGIFCPIDGLFPWLCNMAGATLVI